LFYGASLLGHVNFPCAEVLGPWATGAGIKALIERCGSVFVKPIFRGGVGKKGTAGLIGRAADLTTALREKERLFFIEHKVGDAVAKVQVAPRRSTTT
jgi:hypothetical protein